MSRNWVSDLKTSSRLFLACVWPAIQVKCGGGEIRAVEVIDDSRIAKELDVLAGIDVWQTVTGEGVRGIASRVQWGESAIDPRTGQPWNTFTIRYRRQSGVDTEFTKRIQAIRTGRWIWPYLTVQGYVSDEQDARLLSCAVVRSRDLYEYLDGRQDHLARRTSRDDDGWAEFFYPSWAELRDAGVNVWCPSAPRIKQCESATHRHDSNRNPRKPPNLPTLKIKKTREEG